MKAGQSQRNARSRRRDPPKRGHARTSFHGSGASGHARTSFHGSGASDPPCLAVRDMGQRIAGQSERGLSSNVGDIEHIESASLAGITGIKVFLQPAANIQTAITQVPRLGHTRPALRRRGPERP
jgi:hypothetical protein